MHNSTISEQDLIQIQNNVLSENSKKISSNIIVIDGNKAYEEIFTTNDNINGTMRFERMDFVKNGNVYTIVFQAPDNYFDKEKQNINIILNSFKVQ